jgi:hypothetical protein
MNFFKDHKFEKLFFNNNEILISFVLLGHNAFKHNSINFHDFSYGYNPMFDLVKFCLILIVLVAIIKLLIRR